jgi:hypothetical protein
MTVKDNLIAAKALIDSPEKWGKRFYYQHARTGCMCALGAVRQAVFGQVLGVHDNTPEAEALKDELPKGRWVDEFNDHPSTTHADIMALFQRAIAAQEA